MEAAAWLGAMASLILLLLSASISWHAPGGRFKAYLLLWLLTLAALALAPIYNTPLLPAWLRLLLYSAANLSPMSSALLLFLLFEDRDIGGRSFWLLAGLAVGLDSFDLAMSLQQNWPNDRLGIAVFEYLPQLLKIGFLGLSLYGLLRSWRAELIQGRWRLRHVALGLGMLIGAEMLIVENLWAVQHALPVRVLDRSTDRDHELNRRADVQPAIRDKLRDRDAWNELHHDERAPGFCAAGVLNRRNARVLQL